MSTQTQNATEAGKDIAAKAKADAMAAADDVKNTAADRTESQAENIREASAAFDDNPYARQAAEQISDGLTQMAANLRATDLSTLQNDVTDFARRNPLVFFGGAALLGFAAARIAKASERAEYEVSASDRHNYPSVPDAQRAYPDQNKDRWGHA